MTNNDLNKTDLKSTVVPDTSIIIQGTISKELEANSLKFKRIIIHEAVMAELESQANKGKEIGMQGLEEIVKIRSLSSHFKFVIEFLGSRPGDFEIKFAKTGEIDSLIRTLADKENATLLTADVVQAKVALAKGISVKLYDVPIILREKLLIEDFFVEGAMSVHLKEGCVPFAKIGKPGSWSYTEVNQETLSKEKLESLITELIDFANKDSSSFFESDKRFSSIIQVKDIRIVVVRNPLSDALEITAIRPVSYLSIEDYNLDKTLISRLLLKAEGLLVAGPPGHGKSTFVQCLADKYVSLNKVVKTLESPRDLVVNKKITRYGSNQVPHTEIRDVLLLSRPDFVLFDEVRNVEDFRLFSDLRLSGIGMLGVIHASEPIDAVQRFIGRLDLGVIPHVLDTVVFIKNGAVAKVFSLSLSVKVPSGMIEADLARPVIMINDFFTGRLEYEVYSYGEEAIVVPISSFSDKKQIYQLAKKQLLNEIKPLGFEDVKLEFISDNRCKIFVPKDDIQKILGPKGINISALQKKHSLRFEVVEKTPSKFKISNEQITFSITASSKHILFDLAKEYADGLVSIFVNDDFIMNVKSSKKSQIKVSLDSPPGKILNEAYSSKKLIKVLHA